MQVAARLDPNKYESEVLIDGQRLPILDAAIGYEGKRRVLVLRITDFKLLPESRCPERHRYENVMAALGSESAVAALEPVCSLLKLNCRACSGCKDRPI